MMTAEKLREIYGDPTPRAIAKEISCLDQHCRDFIANASLLLLATTDGERLDVSPKGDPAGFVKVEDEKHLLLPDRPGNNRVDGMMNILRNPSVALIFMIPTVNETLRVNGTATILDDADLCAQFKFKNKPAKTVLRIRAEEVFTHCGKSLSRAGLWRPDTWPAARPLPSHNEIIRDHSEIA